MPEVEVLLSRLAADQLANLSPNIGRSMASALLRLTRFPESAPVVPTAGYEDYRQVTVDRYRAIYRYFPASNEVRVYCILHTRRALPATEFLIYQLF